MRAEEKRVSGPTLIQTKLLPPVLRREIVARPALVERLCQSRRLAVIRAPAGWGKSTLLAAWAEADDRRFAWFTLDSGDNEPTRFWLYLVEALRLVEPTVGRLTTPMLRAPGVDVIDDVLPVLVNELTELEHPTVLALDDYHLIRSEKIHAGVAYLLEYLPQRLELAVAGRAEPPLPLARLRARGELEEVDAHSLSFSAQEAEALLNDLNGLELTENEITALHKRTEGWAAGLYLAVLSLRGRADRQAFIDGFAGDDRNVVDYLGAEVLALEGDDVRRFLRRTSILDRFCAPLCASVVETADAATALSKLERSNLFLVPLDTTREWYRYHHLFGELLRLELQEAEPELEPELHRRAARWLLGAGFASEAIEHTLKAGDHSAAAELIAANWAPVLLGRGEHWTVLGWLEALPQPTVEGDSRLCVARVVNCLGLGKVAQAKRWVEAAERATPSGPYLDGFSSHEAAVASVRASYLVLVGDLSGTIAATEAASAAEGEDAPWHGVVAASAAMARRWQGLLDDAAQELGRYLERYHAPEQGSFAAYTLGNLAAIEADRENWDVAEQLATQAAELSEAMGTTQHWGTASIHLALAKVAEHRGALAQAEAAAERAVALHRYGGPPQERAYSMLTLAAIRGAAGDRTGGRAYLAEARRLIADAVEAGVVPDLIARAERRLGAGAPRPPATAAEELSERELAVLRLLTTRLSQREIGREMYVSMNTVKTHTKSIFRKLGVSSREEAVARARELGLGAGES